MTQAILAPHIRNKEHSITMHTLIRALAGAALVVGSIGFGGLAGAPAVQADANPNANCVGSIASTGSGPDSQGAGGQALAEIARDFGGLGQFISDSC